jgi:hypothetical protein
MPDFKARHSPASMAHIVRHDAEAFSFQFAANASRARIRQAVPEARKHQAVAVEIRANQQHGAAYGVQLD